MKFENNFIYCRGSNDNGQVYNYLANFEQMNGYVRFVSQDVNGPSGISLIKYYNNSQHVLHKTITYRKVDADVWSGGTYLYNPNMTGSGRLLEDNEEKTITMNRETELNVAGNHSSNYSGSRFKSRYTEYIKELYYIKNE